jgi:glycosyltransferase involved in cell wall biosynthesis
VEPSSLSKHKYTITVVIPAYNAEHCIERCIESVLTQTHKADEVIVIDDGSTDNTAEKVKEFDQRVRYIYQPNKGVSAARNHGIKEAASNWIAFLDSDDEWMDSYLENHIALLRRNPNLHWSSGNFICQLHSGHKKHVSISQDKAKKLLAGKDYFENYFDAYSKSARGNSDTMLINRNVFQEVGVFNESKTIAEDTDLWWRIAYQYPQIGYLVEPLAVYYIQRPGSLSGQSSDNSSKEVLELLDRHQILSAKYGHENDFKLLAGSIITASIRSLLFKNQPEQIRSLVSKYKNTLSTRFKMLIFILLISPSFTANMCHTISKIVRKLGLRKKIVRPPERESNKK